VYNALGQSVRTLLASEMAAGRHELTWDGRDDRGNGVASGVYFYRLYAQDRVRSRSLVLLR
jgi:flagellar hook assembly protein FlgD